jgi:predicted ribosomally synthesized peptide with nif11-like leader
MSIEHAKEFIKHLHKDADLRNEVRLSTEHIVSAAKKKGYEVTPEELKSALKQHWEDDPASPVLSEAPGF